MLEVVYQSKRRYDFILWRDERNRYRIFEDLSRYWDHKGFYLLCEVENV